MKYSPKRTRRKSTVAWLLIVILLAVFSLSACGSEGEELKWSDIYMGDQLPNPDKDKAEIIMNSDSSLLLRLSDVSGSQYRKYVEECKTLGYTVEVEENSDSFKAFNGAGYALELRLSSDKEMTIDLDAPVKMGEINWPFCKLAEMLPDPGSNTGKVEWEYSDKFYIYVGNVGKDAYAEYVTACQAAGFDVDYNKGDDYYYADNAAGDSLQLYYKGNSMIAIKLELHEEETVPTTETTEPAETQAPETTAAPTEAPTEAATKATEKKDDGLIGADFKQAMDDYEAFMDEYVEFMKKYSQSGGTDISMLGEYAEFMDKYTKCMESFEKWEDEELNAAELAYYLEVQTRVQKKLMSVY